MGEKRTVIYKLERHKWPDEIEAEKKARRRKFAVVCSCLLFFAAGFFCRKRDAGNSGQRRGLCRDAEAGVGLYDPE